LLDHASYLVLLMDGAACSCPWVGHASALVLLAAGADLTLWKGAGDLEHLEAHRRVRRRGGAVATAGSDPGLRSGPTR